MKDKLGKFEILINPDGTKSFKTDPNIPDDVEKLGKFLTDNKETLKELIGTQTQQPVQSAPAHHSGEFGATFESVLKKYEDRRKDEVASKTVYQYGLNIRKFLAWSEDRAGYKPLIMYQIDRRFIAQYVEYLRKNGVGNLTIENKHMRPLNTIFDFASSIGEFPDIEAPSRGHRLKATKQDKNSKIPRKPFGDDDLKKIFNPATYLQIKHPDGFWLPLLSLYTGARLNELCKLAYFDIGETDGVHWIHINEDNGSLKNEASHRKTPLHPQLIELGFLDYVADLKKWGGMLFPHLKPDAHGSYIKNPSRRFGEYLDKIGMTDKGLVFHSFRSTVSDLLKQSGVPAEERDDFIGHEHNTVDAKHYTQKFQPKYLAEKVAPHLIYDLDLSPLRYTKDRFERFLRQNLKKRDG